VAIPLNKVLALVGKLDDSEGKDTARERFRSYLKEEVIEVSQLRDYIEECLIFSGIQYSRALQDLVNHLGQFLGFTVHYGRYQGVQGHNGFDGHWISPTEDFHIVVEVKTSEVYPIKTSILVGYIEHLISDQQIPSWEEASGLYVVGRIDNEIQQLESRIVAEKRTNQLRSISVKSLLSLAEMMNHYSFSHKDVVSVIRPSSPRIDSVISLMERLVCRQQFEEELDENFEPDKNFEPEEEEAVTIELEADEQEELDENLEREKNKLFNKQDNLRRLPRGYLTPEEAYYLPILKALNDFGGSAKRKDTLAQVAKLMKGVLKEVDYQLLPSDPKTLRWEHTARMTRSRMVKKGFLKNDSPKGIWEISEAGHPYLAERTAND